MPSCFKYVLQLALRYLYGAKWDNSSLQVVSVTNGLEVKLGK